MMIARDEWPRDADDSSALSSQETTAPQSKESPRRARRWPCSEIGRVLCGRYRLEAEIGAGSMGKVYQAMDLKRRQLCAVKLVRPEADLNLHAHRRFSNEAKVLSRLYHPNIVSVREFNQDQDDVQFMVFELLEGMDLNEAITLYRRLPLGRSLEILRGVGSALQYAHDLGIIHRDIKPENVFLCRQRSARGHVSEIVKVLDFGLAKLINDERAAAPSDSNEVRLTQGIAVGTPVYLAPEATQDGTVLDGRTDQWSLAVMAYQMLSGQLPFDHQSPLHLCQLICTAEARPLQELQPGLPPHVCQAIEKGLSKNPEDRFPRVYDFIRALESPAATTAPNIATSPPHSDYAKDTLGAPRGLSAESATWLHSSDLAEHKSEPAQLPMDVRQTVQYSADELLALACQSMQVNTNVPQAIDEGPTKPYRLTGSGPIAEPPKNEKKHEKHDAKRDLKKDGMGDGASSVSSLIAVQETQLLPIETETLFSDLKSTVLVPSAQSGAQLEPRARRPKRRRQLRSLAWFGIGAGSAMFCLGFLLVLFWAWQPRSHGISLKLLPTTSDHG